MTIYFFSAYEKLINSAWQNGTALHQWMKDPHTGMPDWLTIVIDPIAGNHIGGLIISFVVICFEFLLAIAIFLTNEWKKRILVTGILFHLTISMMFGLVGFLIVMSAALLLYLYPATERTIISYN